MKIDYIYLNYISYSLESDIMSETLDSAYIEHDTFCLFEKLMYHGKSWYEFKEKNTFSKNSIDSSESSEVNKQ